MYNFEVEPPFWYQTTFISPRTVKVDRQTLRQHKKGGSVTLHLRPGKAAIVRGKRRRQGWTSYYGTRELAQQLLKVLQVIPKKALAEIWYVESKTEVRGTIELIEAGMVRLTQDWENQLIVRCGAFEVQFYGWTEAQPNIVLAKVA